MKNGAALTTGTHHFHSHVVEKSASCNTVQLVVDSDGEVIVPMYFQICSSMPGVVVAKNHSDSDEIIKDGVN